MNSVKVAALMVALVIIFMWLGYAAGGRGGMIVAFAVATVLNFGSYWYSDKIILKMYRARPISEVDHPRLYRVVKRVATRAVLPMPKVYIIRSKAPNAFATGRNAEHAAVAATEGLLQILNEEELEAVMGHEIAHIMNRDLLIGCVAATFAGAIGLLAYAVRWGAFFGGYGYGRDVHRGGGIGQLLAALVAPLAAIIIQTAISRQREYKADARGAHLTGKYLALASALGKLHQAPTRFAIEQHPATAHLMIANPLSRRSFSSLFSTHPSVEKRIARLEKLSQQSIYTGYA